jgi:hypothetical protein
MPQREEDWNAICDDFWNLWNFPNCLGAIDGKLVHIQRPIVCGGQYFNYKRTFSVNMMAVVDAKYRFLYVTVGAQGSANDAAVLSQTLGWHLLTHRIHWQSQLQGLYQVLILKYP